MSYKCYFCDKKVLDNNNYIREGYTDTYICIKCSSIVHDKFIEIKNNCEICHDVIKYKKDRIIKSLHSDLYYTTEITLCQKCNDKLMNAIKLDTIFKDKL